MLKAMFTLIKGSAHDADEAFKDTHALKLLQQQSRDATSAVQNAKRALAIAMASGRTEQQQTQKLRAKLAELESRAIAALEKGEKALAAEAAEAIANHENDLGARENAERAYEAEITRLRQNLQTAEARLRDLERGRRLAETRDRTQRISGHSKLTPMSKLAEAESTLKRVEKKQSLTDQTQAALDELTQPSNLEATNEKLQQAGLGPSLKIKSADVLARLSKKAKASA